ncbi:hypothetical protein Vretimale_17862 [Volvox reticuliferus]|uniref:Uncharacterized protein n=1 Tax=Volvox reticuliferus TaxID=1737510 RepID=A0A8J4LXQ6_9CHLO|nr:hypothetical protein Vretimale_17862 [Volvox reticuliferus]
MDEQEELDLAMMPPPLTHKVATIEDHRQKTLDRLLQSQRVTRSSAAAIAASHGAVGFHVPREASVDRDQRCHEDDEPALKRVRRLKNTQPSCDSTGVGTARVSGEINKKGQREASHGLGNVEHIVDNLYHPIICIFFIHHFNRSTACTDMTLPMH